MYNVVILPLASEDIRQASSWYELRQKGLGKKFVSELRETAKFIKHEPQAAGIRYGDIRVVALKVFPFMIHYAIDENNKNIIILAVFHTSRNPDIWKSR
ncbi:MAG: type II toxin-antitoxin system RelE/ParE family toxin [Lentimicrobium sp.]